MSVVRDEYDRVLCPHGRPMACLECGEDYARAVTTPARTACDDCLDERRRLAAQRDELLAALKGLRADVVGALGIGVSESIGHTNAAVLGHWCQVAYEAIQKAEKP